MSLRDIFSSSVFGVDFRAFLDGPAPPPATAKVPAAVDEVPAWGPGGGESDVGAEGAEPEPDERFLFPLFLIFY